MYHGDVATEPDEARKLVMELDMAEAVARSPFAERIREVLDEAHEMLFDAPVKRLSESD